MANEPRKSPQAEIDLTSIWDFIADDSVKAADALLVRIEELFDMLAQSPLDSRARNELAMKLRSFPVGNYVIAYHSGVRRHRGRRAALMSGRQDIAADDMA